MTGSHVFAKGGCHMGPDDCARVAGLLVWLSEGRRVQFKQLAVQPQGEWRDMPPDVDLGRFSLAFLASREWRIKP